MYKNKQTKGIVDRKGAAEYMNQTRFKFIKTHWVEQFELDLTENQKQANKWWRMGYLIQGFNENRSRSVAASRVLTMDESMSAFRPQTEKTGNLPNISYIMRKPEDLGTELKGVASTSCNGPMLHLEVQEGKEPMKKKIFCSTYGTTCSCTLRMAQATQNNGNKPDPLVRNLYYGDSWFASLRTAAAVRNELSCEFVGVVKNAHKNFPRKFLEDTMSSWPPGSHLVMETTLDVTNTLPLATHKEVM